MTGAGKRQNCFSLLQVPLSKSLLAQTELCRTQAAAAANAAPLGDELGFMALDIIEEKGKFQVWGTVCGASLLVRVVNFQPYFYVEAPTSAVCTSLLFSSQKLVLATTRAML